MIKFHVKLPSGLVSLGVSRPSLVSTALGGARIFGTVAKAVHSNLIEERTGISLLSSSACGDLLGLGKLRERSANHSLKSAWRTTTLEVVPPTLEDLGRLTG